MVLNESLRTEWDTTVLGHSESQRVGHYQLYLVPAEWDNNRRAAAATSSCSAALRHDANTAVATAAAAKAAWYNQRRAYRQLRHRKCTDFWCGKLEANKSNPVSYGGRLTTYLAAAAYQRALPSTSKRLISFSPRRSPTYG